MHTFAARYPGTCAEGDRIEPGDEVTYLTDNTLAHVKCEAGAKPGRNERKCEKCFMLHAGDCF